MLSSHLHTNGFETDLGARVRALRRERGLTLKGLGKKAGLSHPFLSQVERGLARPSVGSVERIAAALDVSVARLWSPSRTGETVQESFRQSEGERDEQGLRDLGAVPGAPVLREWTARNRRWPDEYDVQDGELAIYVARGASRSTSTAPSTSSPKATRCTSTARRPHPLPLHRPGRTRGPCSSPPA